MLAVVWVVVAAALAKIRIEKIRHEKIESQNKNKNKRTPTKAGSYFYTVCGRMLLFGTRVFSLHASILRTVVWITKSPWILLSFEWENSRYENLSESEEMEFHTT